MDTYFCRARVSVFDPKTKHNYNEQDIRRYVEAPTLEEAMESFRRQARMKRYPIAPAYVLIKFRDVNRRFEGCDIGVIPYKGKK